MSPPTLFTTDELCAEGAPLHAQERSVRFQDVDAAGTIYFPRVLEYFADAYLGLLEAAGLDVPGMLRDRTLAAPLRHAEADYLRPLFFGDAVQVEVFRARLGTTSVHFGHRLRDRAGRVAAVGQTIHVFVDGRTFTPAPVPEALRRFLEAGPR